MQEQDDILHERIKNVIVDVMAVLYEHNITKVHMGAMMRLLGVSDSKASVHDDQVIELDEKFGDMLAALNKSTPTIDVPADVTFH